VAVPPVKEKTVDLVMFEEALRLGNDAARRADRYREISTLAIDAIEGALLSLRSGRSQQARERLETAVKQITAHTARLVR
jgi:hypothetical protein